jgi:hypothetical protein
MDITTPTQGRTKVTTKLFDEENNCYYAAYEYIRKT